ncbi:Eco57I restriction-modification methylase domain-containing protein [Paenarthrobacter sp. NEAU-H11]|uniref:Eco57I restriction-modification methylase domain-containing protein n=1 Tax=Paenarthrobacter sp. NEAU-H11 TaxID=3423924 RepID=UPI003D33D8DA
MMPYATQARVGVPSVITAPSLPAGALAVVASLPNWWRKRALRAGLDGFALDLSKAVQTAPPAVWLGSPDFSGVSLENSSYQIGGLYVNSLDPAVRADKGKHYTPPALARNLWSMAREGLGWDAEPHRLEGLVRDPACGSGALLIPVVDEHLTASVDDDPALVLRRISRLIEGVDQDPWAVYIANVILAARMLPTLAKVPVARREPLPALASVGDGLDQERDESFVTIMNPPYGRVTLSPADRSRFANILFGHANLYSMFMAVGAQNIRPGGVLATVVPTSFTAGLYFHRLRRTLSEEAPLRSINFVNDRSGVFTGVLQETCLAVFAKTESPRTKITRTRGKTEEVASVPTPRTDRPWLLPRSPEDASIAAAAAAMPNTLSTAGWHASTGPLVWNRRKADLHPRHEAGRIQVIWAADIDDGYIHRDAGRDPMRYLQVHGDRDLRFMSLGEPAILVQRTTSLEQGRRLVAAELTENQLLSLGGRVAVESHVNVLRPNTPFPLIDRVTLGRVLATDTMDRLFRCISGSVAVSSYELASLPLPDKGTLAQWSNLNEEELRHAVAETYCWSGEEEMAGEVALLPVRDVPVLPQAAPRLRRPSSAVPPNPAPRGLHVNSPNGC